MFNKLLKPIWLSSVLMSVVVLSGCATGPIEFEQEPTVLSVMQVRAAIAEGDAVPLNNQVLWGGTVLNVANLAQSTQVEIMAHPLDRRQRPMTRRTAQGRFVASYEGFVEPLDFPVGQVITFLGTLSEPVSGAVGEAAYVYPSIKVVDSHLWRVEELAPKSGVTFGIGINLGN